MEQRALGRSGLVVSRLALGTMTWGRDTDEDEAAMQLTAFVDAGGTLVDTADVYCDGESERTLGHLLTDVVPRSDVLVATKAVGRTRPGPMGRGASRGHLLAALDASLERLAWTTSTSGSCTPGTTPRRWRRPSPPATSPSPPAAPATSASATSPAGRPRRRRPGSAPGPAARRWSAPRSSTRCCSGAWSGRSCRPPSRWVSACWPGRRWAAGILTGKYRHSTPSESRGASPQWQGFIDGLRSAKSDRIVEAVITAAEGLGTSPLAVALAWVRDRPGVVAPVVGARTAQQLQASLDADGVRLPAAIRTALEDVSAPPFAYPERRSDR